MPIAARGLTAAIFFALMFLWKTAVHATVDLGFIPWLFLIGGVFWVAIGIENRDRRRDGKPLYSWREAGELFAPLSVAAIIVLAYSYSAVVRH
jgi:hypothetical protein